MRKNKLSQIIAISLVIILNCGIIHATGFDVSESSSTSINIESYDLKDIAGYSATIDENTLSELNESNIFNDLMVELRPYLKDIIDESIDSDHVFTTSEVIGMIMRHPLKFLAAIYNYVVTSLKDIFNIASDSATLVTE